MPWGFRACKGRGPQVRRACIWVSSKYQCATYIRWGLYGADGRTDAGNLQLKIWHFINGFDHRIGHLWPLSMTAEFSNAPPSRAEVRVPRTDAAGMADAMSDALFPIRSGASVLGLPTLAWASLVQT